MNRQNGTLRVFLSNLAADQYVEVSNLGAPQDAFDLEKREDSLMGLRTEGRLLDVRYSIHSLIALPCNIGLTHSSSAILEAEDHNPKLPEFSSVLKPVIVDLRRDPHLYFRAKPDRQESYEYRGYHLLVHTRSPFNTISSRRIPVVIEYTVKVDKEYNPTPASHKIGHFFIPTPTFTENELPDQTGKVHIVTGGYVRCGFQLVRFLYQKNAVIYVAGRSKDKADLAIKELKAEFPTSTGRLHFLRLPHFLNPSGKQSC
ncbi:hypothetical protein HDV00_008587 [Rhizophlyctis rosea]|nr:hypothetical protein HDV00_008587 [Rhizophlyctis rosea]